MITILAILLCALLFVAYGLLRTPGDCGGACGACTNQCELKRNVS